MKPKSDTLDGMRKKEVDAAATHIISGSRPQNIQEEASPERLALEIAGIGVFEWDLSQEDHFEYSDRLASIYGYTDAAGLARHHFENRVYPDDQDKVKQALYTAMETGNLLYQARVVWPDGSLHRIRVTGRAFFNGEGKADRLFGTAVEISTEQAGTASGAQQAGEDTAMHRRRPEELEKSEEQYRKMVDEVQDYSIILLDQNGFIVHMNKGAEKIKKYTESEAVGKHFSLFYLPEDIARKLPDQLLETAAREGRAVHEGWRVCKDGTKFWGSITITALHDKDNNIIGFTKVTRDLTTQKIADDRLKNFTEELRLKNEALQKSEERYHKMVEEVQDYAIILLNEKGDIENWNAGAEAIKGYTFKEAIGKNFRVFYTQGDRERGLPDSLLEEARLRGKALHEGWRVRKDGSVFWGSIVITALHAADSSVIGFSKVTRDLTELKYAHDKMQQYTAELEAKNKELEQFAYLASHDLQEPLRKIQLFSELTRKNLDDKALLDKYLEKINSSASRMADLIRSVLNYSRISKEVGQVVATDLNKVLQEVKTDFELLIEEKKAEITSEQLPVIPAVPLLVHQLFLNLIGNALKFSTGQPHIRVSSQTVPKAACVNPPPGLADGLYTEIVVSDNGIGFDQQYANLIFAMFQRLHDKQAFKGTGIGLALCRKIMEIHSGYITAKSEVDRGAQFFVYFPLR
ncbi:MAG: PAS domain S-box protein [Williamsia sp.]|nr:PAS domain S-box protein [Williamsia sp.]